MSKTSKTRSRLPTYGAAGRLARIVLGLLSRPHGWVELSIADDRIPEVPEGDETPNVFVRPPECYVSVRLEGEPYASIAVFPTGDRAPFAVKSGMRFPAPVGPARVEVSYRGCDVDAGEAATRGASIAIAVAESRVTEIAFDGDALVASAPRNDTVVTLDDVYEAVTGHPKN